MQQAPGYMWYHKQCWNQYDHLAVLGCTCFDRRDPVKQHDQRELNEPDDHQCNSVWYDRLHTGRRGMQKVGILGSVVSCGSCSVQLFDSGMKFVLLS